MRIHWILSSALGILFLIPAMAASPPLLPTFEAETLLGAHFRIPEDFRRAPTWIVLGFSRGSGEATSRCSTLLEQVFPGRGYSAALLEGAPFFIKGTIKASIRSSVPKARQERYLILNDRRSEWATLAGSEKKSENDAYIIGLRPRESNAFEIAFVSHGDCAEAHYSQLTERIRGILKR